MQTRMYKRQNMEMMVCRGRIKPDGVPFRRPKIDIVKSRSKVFECRGSLCWICLCGRDHTSAPQLGALFSVLHVVLAAAKNVSFSVSMTQGKHTNADAFSTRLQLNHVPSSPPLPLRSYIDIDQNRLSHSLDFWNHTLQIECLRKDDLKDLLHVDRCRSGAKDQGCMHCSGKALSLERCCQK